MDRTEGRLSLRAAALLAFVLLFPAAARAASVSSGTVLSGLDALEADGFRELRGLRIGLTTNQAGRDRRGRWSGEVLASAPGVRLAALFAPEHGLSALPGASSDSYRFEDGRTVPIYPSFGGVLEPTPEMLRGLDAVVFDLQGAGVRFYTYSTTIAMGLELAAKNGKRVIVLDRPDPIDGTTVEGPVLDPDIRSFVSYLPVPTRHGMTMGELALLANARIHAKLTVVRMKGWRRDMWYDQTGLPWTAPSPNMPDLASATAYPGISSLEAANLSVGRGTPTPLQWIGAPWLDADALLAYLKKHPLPGIAFEARTYTPTRDRWHYKGERCPGVFMKVTDRDAARPLDAFAVLACGLRDTQHGRFKLSWHHKGEDAPKHGFFLPTTRRLVGSERFRALYESGAPPERIIAFFRKSSARFKTARRRFLLY